MAERDYSEYVPYSQYGYMKRTYGPLWWLPPEDAAVNHQPIEDDVVVVRAMDYKEFAKLVVGRTLKKKTVWQKRGLRSTSVGFCFFKEGSDLEDQFIDENHRIFVYLKFRKFHTKIQISASLEKPRDFVPWVHNRPQ